jgi:hypothetical protein
MELLAHRKSERFAGIRQGEGGLFPGFPHVHSAPCPNRLNWSKNAKKGRFTLVGGPPNVVGAPLNAVGVGLKPVGAPLNLGGDLRKAVAASLNALGGGLKPVGRPRKAIGHAPKAIGPSFQIRARPTAAQ